MEVTIKAKSHHKNTQRAILKIMSSGSRRHQNVIVHDTDNVRRFVAKINDIIHSNMKKWHKMKKKITIFNLTLLMLKLEYFGQTRAKLWLLIPWFLASPEHQQPWYWLCRITRSVSSIRKNLNHMHQCWKTIKKMQIYFLRFSNSFWSDEVIWNQEILINIDPGNGLVPDVTKPLPEPMLTYYQCGS